MSMPWRAVIALLLLCPSAYADDDWWFDIEVIVFDRNQAITALSEQFDYAPSLAPANADYDLLSAYMMPDITPIARTLPDCDAPPFLLWQAAPALDDIITAYRERQDALMPTGLPDITSTNPDLLADSATDSDVATSLTVAASADDASPVQDSASENISEPVPVVSDSDIARYWLDFHTDFSADYTQVPAVTSCLSEPDWLVYKNGQWQRQAIDIQIAAPERVPLLPEGNDWYRAAQPHLLPSGVRELTSLSQQIRSTRGLTRLLHTVWRQEVKFGQDNAATFRLVAGENYASRFTADGYEKHQNDNPGMPESDTAITPSTLFDTLDSRLAAPDTVSFSRMMAASPENPSDDTLADQTVRQAPLWQIDGTIKVFLRYVNRVPYLHIDNALFYRQPVPVNDSLDVLTAEAVTPEYKLVSVPFSQLRRVISKQVHYFDHPLFGMIVEIRRHERPAPEPADETQEQTDE
ncbi:CsiV family protein [Alteromonas sp. CYL-A6]|uniref:CsiV family protein n=1 Tax=Alteromonas nitratireducens TaxID=3390813 RepID=UPI0034B1F886